jgi:hypothetical protein
MAKTRDALSIYGMNCAKDGSLLRREVDPWSAADPS